jgi:phosphoribosylanthranilate isomerase
VSPVHIKVCGITDIEDAEACLALGVSAIGLNLVPSSRRVVDVSTARAIARHVSGRAIIVLVVADLGVLAMRELLRATGAGCLQLHGEERPEVLSELLPHAYKAVRIGSPEDATAALAYPGDHLLIDAKVPGELGGTGQTADWSIAASLARQRKLTLAGGLTSANVAAAINAVHPYAVDVASGVEDGRNVRRKDPDRLSAFVAAVRSCESE